MIGLEMMIGDDLERKKKLSRLQKYLFHIVKKSVIFQKG